MNKQQAHELIRFLIAGAAAVGTDFGVYFALCRVLPPGVSKTASFICGGVVSYALNKHWAFKSRRASSSEAIRFIVFNTGLLIQNVLTNQGVLSLWPKAMLGAVILATIITSVAAYIGFKWWVFRVE